MALHLQIDARCSTEESRRKSRLCPPPEPNALRRPGVGMHRNKAEVMPEAGLEEPRVSAASGRPGAFTASCTIRGMSCFHLAPSAASASFNCCLYQLAQFVTTLVVSSVEDLEDKSFTAR